MTRPSPAPQPADGEREVDPWATEPADWTREQAEAAQAELDALELTDPAVRAAAESYDRMVKRVTRRKPTTPASAEPTAEQRLWALTFVTRVLECETPEQIDATERDLARALAAAVTAEREKYLRVAEQMHPEGTRGSGMDDWGRGADWAYADAARRIREVSS